MAAQDSTFVPDIVKQFVFYFYRERNIPEISSMYEISWLKLSERYFKSSSWPAVELIYDVVDQDHVFCLLYKEMYFRHLYARCTPDLRQRCESWDNYCDLFGLLLHSNVNMQLPNIWLWDMVDEFIYQFQSFCQYRGKIASKSPEELELLRQCDKVWNVHEVLNVLQALIDKSGITAELEADGGAKFFAAEGYYPNQTNVLRMLGYFSLVGLQRVHCLIGDYHTALKSLYPINMNSPQNLYTPKIAGCNITLFYYGGFSYLMMRSSKWDLDQSPSFMKLLDENVVTQLRERNNEKISKMSHGEIGVFDELFTYACPKFITATPPSFENPSVNTNQQAYRTQLNLFLQEVRSQQTLPLLKQYLILYSSISTQKLASLMDVDVAHLRTSLICLKNKAYNMKWNGGVDATSGTFAAASDIDFYLDIDATTGQEMVIVSEAVHTRHHADFLVRHIGKFEEIIRDLEAPPAAAAPAAGAAPPASGAAPKQAVAAF
eukprot:gene1226-32567_t